LWNQQLKADRYFQSNKRDNIIHDNEKGTYILIDVAISKDRNGINIEEERIGK
jgi:hypothetical protein